MAARTAIMPAPPVVDRTARRAALRGLRAGTTALAASVQELAHYPYPCSTLRAQALRDHVVGVGRAAAHLLAARERSGDRTAAGLREGFCAAVHWAKELAADTRDRRSLRRLAATMARLAGSVDALVSAELRGPERVHGVLEGLRLRDAAFVLPWLVSCAGAADRAVLLAAMGPRERLQLWWSAGRHRSRAHLALGGGGPASRRS